MPRKSSKVIREGDQTQKTEKGYEIPVPKREDFDELLRKAAKRTRGEPRSRP